MVLLLRSYAGYAAATIVQFSTVLEASLVAAGIAAVSAGPVTPGAVSTTALFGRVGIAAAGTSVVITNPQFTTETKFGVALANAAADATALYVTRVTPANGTVTFTLNAAATAAVAIDWAVLSPGGGLVTLM